MSREREDNAPLADLPVYETEPLDMPQVSLPFATDAKGQTLDEKMVEGRFLCGDGQSEPCMLMASCHDVQDRVA